MDASIKDIIETYKPDVSLADAWTIPASWYVDPRIHQLERRTVFSHTWQVVARTDQVNDVGQFVTCDLAGEPLVIIRGEDRVLRGFFNVCRHHAAAVATETNGSAKKLQCPYHGWTYSLQGQLLGTPDFAGVREFDRNAMGLVPVEIAVWEKWVFAKLDSQGPPLDAFFGSDLIGRIRKLNLAGFHWVERRTYTFDCNWKVFVDNYLDGGYHIPHIHGGLDSVLDYAEYTIENGERYCLQSSPLRAEGGEQATAEVRTGSTAHYYWIYPNFMINWYEGTLDTNFVVPLAVDRTQVIFDFYFTDVSERAASRNIASIEVAQRIQSEDTAICKSVQRGLTSRAYTAGRLSVRREAGEQLFHQLLYMNLKSGL